MNLEITKEKVLEAASKCETAKATLKVLFPEVFDNEAIEISPFSVSTETSENKYMFIGLGLAPVEYCGKCLVLNKAYFNWEIREEFGYTILIPKPKE